MSVDTIDDSWTVVARLDELAVDRGAAALIDGVPVAIFRLADGTVAAIDHVEPFTGMPVLARGLIGSVGEVTFVASPLHKQRFDLRTGTCLDDPAAAVRTWAVTVRGDHVYVAPQPVSFVPGTNETG